MTIREILLRAIRWLLLRSATTLSLDAMAGLPKIALYMTFSKIILHIFRKNPYFVFFSCGRTIG